MIQPQNFYTKSTCSAKQFPHPLQCKPTIGVVLSPFSSQKKIQFIQSGSGWTRGKKQAHFTL
jgi:hypothetical protein